ncbi:hypothetical protein B0I35DRAFT_411120 [Stachybotrys elegans]|uniref:SMP-30/Gluconolactonase/LRE-like region domain-containing protein n=1 Tax=Stachybotrys elegans TaxID=80388 RepID=A0A8K0WQ89_9HYPO|nr:hypothetical protein B0I35DRAFT_411120 [Stachybotrys elegans]
MKTYTITELTSISQPFLDLKCGLAESPIWEERGNILRFVDIAKKNVYRINLDKGLSSLQKHQYEYPICVTAIDASSDDSFVFAVVFRLDLDGTLRRVAGGFTLPNGMSWSKDDTKMYLADTAASKIFVYDFDKETGSITNQRVFLDVKEEGAGPDGHAQDEEGNLWVAVGGGWKIICVTPEGDVVAEAVAFAGEDIYITSETEKEPEKYPESVRLQGAVFKCHVGVRGKRLAAAVVS